MNVLIVDDSRAMRLLITRALKGIGLPDTNYLEAPDGEAALHTIRQLRPELVLSDFNMPGMSGMDLLRALKAQEIPTRFGFVTSEASSQLHDEARAAGALFVITKPFTAANLSQTLEPVLADLGCQVRDGEDESAEAYTDAEANVPITDQIATILKELLRRPVTVSHGPAVPIPPPSGNFVVEYLRMDDGVVIGCGIYDIVCAARLGAALTLMPPGAAAEAIAAGGLEGIMAENFREVLNVLSRLFGGGSSRVCLGAVHAPGAALSGEVAMRAAKSRARFDGWVEIGGYGKGNLRLVFFG